MQIRFLHISDIHCGYSNYGVNQMREKLAPQLLKFTQDKGQTIDYLFITGDLKYGPTCKEGYPPEALAFVREIQSSFGIKPDHTFVVPGNHDVKRGDMRTAAINGIKADYRSHIGNISDDHLMMLDMTQREYHSLYQEICGNSCHGNHFFVDLGPVNVIHLNTALICGSDGEDGSLIVGTTMLRDSLNGMDTSKPAIALAHHSFDCLTQEEQVKLERLLKEKNSLVYLCGHKHVNRFQQIASEVKDKPMWEILCGTNMDSAPNVEQTEMSVYVGTLDTNGSCGYIDAYKWSRRNEEWMPDSEFSRRECGCLDGRFYFPSREVNLSIEASDRYLDYLRRTYTDIQLDGLPADGHVGSRRFPLDSLYVPARFRRRITENTAFAGAITAELTPQTTEPCAAPFETKSHAVVLAGPGCGKTTYMKKVISDHISGICDDGLYPVLIRCRSLNDRLDLSITGILRDLPLGAEFPTSPSLHQAFSDMVCAKLQLGGILLLIDGLDEISDGRKRSQFIQQLEAFRCTYPQNCILVTSRFAGYDDYTGSGLSEFEVLELDDFSEDDIRSLCVNWHHAVVNNTRETTNKALELANAIIDHDRIKSLAKNPLLLTTLLLVQRRVGRLPTKRAALYDEAIKVLLETWNQEGHAPLDLDLSTCKLAYIAYRMSCRGINQIIREELLEYLYDAKSDISRKLSYDIISPEDFLKRTEQRSSILIRVGFKTDEQTGKLHEIYEFQHLTFQEYLTAVAVKEKYYPGAGRRDRAIDILNNPVGLNAFDSEPHKHEVILLTAAMAGWETADDIAQHLIGKLCTIGNDPAINHPLPKLGIQLLLDEAELEETTTNALLQELASVPSIYFSYLLDTKLKNAAASFLIDMADRHIGDYSLLGLTFTLTFAQTLSNKNFPAPLLCELAQRWRTNPTLSKSTSAFLALVISLSTFRPPVTEEMLELLSVMDQSKFNRITMYNHFDDNIDPNGTSRTYFTNLLHQLDKYQDRFSEINDLTEAKQ